MSYVYAITPEQTVLEPLSPTDWWDGSGEQLELPLTSEKGLI